MAKNGNNEGSVYKDKKGRWRGVVTLPTVDKKVKKKYFYGKTRKEVSDKVNNVLNQLRNNTYYEPCKTTLFDWLNIWLETYSKQEVRPTTYINYETYIHRHIKDTIGGFKLCDISTLIIQQFYNDKLKNGKLIGTGGLSPKTIRNLHNMLHKALNQAVYLDMIQKNPADFVVIPKAPKKEMLYFTVEEQKKLQEALKGERLGMAILLDLYTGMREGELLGLTWQNVFIDLNGQSYIKVTQTINRLSCPRIIRDNKTAITVNEPKTPHSKRIIPLLPDIAKKLDEYRVEQQKYFKENGFPPSDFVFTSTKGTVIDPRNFQSYFKHLLIRNGIRVINLHGLRHTFATRALESGMSPKTLSKILGHANVGFTLDTYAHVTDDLKANAISQMQTFLE
ncbi:MAG: site-specific integrase [Ruminococcus sp.]|nr:site-specific integrase [Ruminococcus sp.]